MLSIVIVIRLCNSVVFYNRNKGFQCSENHTYSLSDKSISVKDNKQKKTSNRQALNSLNMKDIFCDCKCQYFKKKEHKKDVSMN